MKAEKGGKTPHWKQWYLEMFSNMEKREFENMKCIFFSDEAVKQELSLKLF